MTISVRRVRHGEVPRSRDGTHTQRQTNAKKEKNPPRDFLTDDRVERESARQRTANVTCVARVRDHASRHGREVCRSCEGVVKEKRKERRI